MEDGAVTVHQHHGGRKVEKARGQDTQGSPREERIAGQEPRAVEVVTSAWQDQGGEERDRRGPRQADHGHAALRQRALRMEFTGYTRR